jgi:hypothetical protein
MSKKNYAASIGRYPEWMSAVTAYLMFRPLAIGIVQDAV